MRIEHLLIGLAIFIAVLTLGIQMYESQEIEYNIAIDGDLFSEINITNHETNLESQTDTLRGNTLEGGAEVSDEDTESSIYKDAIDEIRKMGDSVADTNKVIQTTTKAIGVPEFITQLLVRAVIILSIVFVIYMIARYKPQRD